MYIDNIYLLPCILIHCFNNQYFTTFYPLYPVKRVLDGIGNCRIACIRNTPRLVLFKLCNCLFEHPYFLCHLSDNGIFISYNC